MMNATTTVAKIALNGGEYRILSATRNRTKTYAVYFRWYEPGYGYHQKKQYESDRYVDCLNYVVQIAHEIG